MTWDRAKTIKWLGIITDDEEHEYENVNIRKLPKIIIDEFRLIDDKLRPGKKMNIPFWIRVSMINFLEDFYGEKRKVRMEDIDFKDEEVEDD